MNRTRLLTTLLTIATAAVLGCGQEPRPAQAEEATKAPAAQPALVRVAKATVTTLRPSIDLIGTVAAIPERTARVASQIDGKIARVEVVEGQTVTTGQPLIKLDDRMAKNRLARAQAAEQQATATLRKLENGPRPEEIEAAAQEARRLAAVARALRAKLDALEPLQEKGEVSKVEYRQMRAQVEAATAEARSAAARLKLLQAGSRREDIAMARAVLAAAQAEVASARLTLEYCTITSPGPGVIAKLAARVGASVTPTDTLAEVVDTSELFVQVCIPGSRLGAVRPGARADVAAGSRHDKMTRGHIVRLSPLATAESGAVSAFVAVPNDAGGLRPGLARRVRIWLDERPDTLVIPIEAVADRNGVAVVTVIRDNKAYEQSVRLGATAGRFVQVLEGLSAGELVTTEGGYGLPDGCPVRIERGGTK